MAEDDVVDDLWRCADPVQEGVGRCAADVVNPDVVGQDGHPELGALVLRRWKAVGAAAPEAVQHLLERVGVGRSPVVVAKTNSERMPSAKRAWRCSDGFALLAKAVASGWKSMR
jgi:hypothetical protein